jgi:molybdopterin synthase catalytic subunit
MQRDLTITREPIDEARLVSGRRMTTGMGAAVYFAGVVRAQEGDAVIGALDYEANERMAARQFELIFERMEARWPVESVRLVHRIGRVAANEASLWVEVVAPHRGEAFAACQYLIVEMKMVVPIWKRPVT